MRLHKKFEINLPNYYNKKVENEMGTEWLTNRKKYYTYSPSTSQFHR